MSTVAELVKRSPVVLPDLMWRELDDAYASPPRAYHTLEHVLEVAGHYATLQWAQPVEVWHAVLWHDAEYDVSRHDNEQRSADLFASLGLTGVDPARVRELILLTAKHGKLKAGDVDADAAKFLDCDMAILGSAPDRFARYEEQIAAEYVPVVGRAGYALGRRRFLENLLGKERIFLSDELHARFDAQARANLRAALK